MPEATKTEVGSYFISNYPPFSQWSKDAVDEAAAALGAPPRSTASQEVAPLGLYLHLPFCRKRCKFCYFKVFTDKNGQEVERYLAALSKEIELVSQQPIMGGRPFRFVYFGGGTPSFLSSRQLTRLVDRLRENIDWSLAEEVTFECEPGTLSEAKVGTLKEIGVTRLSLGVEHFDDKILRDNGRAHESPEIDRCWPWIEAAGFDSVNIDLISGMAGDTTEKWQAAVRRVIAMQPGSVTIYQMELPFNTVISQGVLAGEESPIATWEQKRDWLAWAFEQLAEAGYESSSAYTMVRPGTKFSYRDNLWHGSDLLATGIASFGHASGVHYQNMPEWEAYLGKLEAGELPLGRALTITPHQALVREMILQLKKGWIAPAYFQAKFGVDVLAEWQAVWSGYQAEGLVGRLDAERIELTRDGLMRADSLLPAFFEEEHQGVRYT